MNKETAIQQACQAGRSTTALHRLTVLSRSHLARLALRAPGTANTLMMLLVAGLITLVFLPATHNGFVWDDWGYLFNIEYSSPEYWTRALTEPLLGFPNYFRPLTVASFIAEIHLRGGYFPGGMHLTNILVHALNSALVTILAYRLGVHRVGGRGRVRLAAVVAGLIYGCHPALVAVTAWISGRFDLLLTSFLLLALLANTLEAHRVARPLLVGMAFLGAALTKEMAVVFPFVLVAWNMAWAPRPLLPLRTLLTDMSKRGEMTVYVSVVLAGIIYLGLRQWSLGQLYTFLPESFSATQATVLQKTLFSTEALGRYLFLMVYPYAGISVVHPHPNPVPLHDPLAWASLAGVVALLIVLVSLVRRHPSTGWLWATLPIALFPVIHILPVPTGDNIIQDWYLTYPLTLYVLALSPLIIRLFSFDMTIDPRRSIARWGILALITCLFVMNVFNVRVTIPLWRDDMTLWTWGATRSPDSVSAQGNLGNTFFDNGRYSDALEQGLKVIRLRPEFYVGYWVAGRALLERGEKQDALAFLQAAVAKAGSTPATEMNINLADAYMRLGRYHEAETVLSPLAKKEPLNRNLNLALCVLYARQGDQKRSDDFFEKSQLMNAPELRARTKTKIDQLLAGDVYPRRRPKNRKNTGANPVSGEGIN